MADKICYLCFDSIQNCYFGVFLVEDYDFLVTNHKFKMVDEFCELQFCSISKIAILVFLGRGLSVFFDIGNYSDKVLKTKCLDNMSISEMNCNQGGSCSKLIYFNLKCT